MLGRICNLIYGQRGCSVELKFGDDDSDIYKDLVSAGAFLDFTSERIFEESGKGVLASL